MRYLLLLGLVLLVSVGCKKSSSKPGKPASESSGGVYESVKRKVKESVNEQQMHQLHLLIEAMATGDTLPSEQQINQELQKDARQLWKLVQDKVIVLTGTKSRNGVWAYTSEPQTAGGEHLAITSSGVTRMSKESIDKQKQ